MKSAIVLVITTCCGISALPALAFHDGGVGQCSVCHVVSNDQSTSQGDPGENPFMLVMKDPSSVCISCHAQLDGTFPVGGSPTDPPAQRAGGSFIFLVEDNLNDAEGGMTNPVPGDAAGHNLLAREYGLAPDATHTVSPGGTYPASVMGCTSCHDPHGNAEFRLLYGSGDMVAPGEFTFVNPAPDAEGLPISQAVSNIAHTAYRNGMSAWCANCHGDFHLNGTNLLHTSGRVLGGRTSTIYNLYNGTADHLGGSASTAYLEQVPYEDPENNIHGTTGPAPDSQISCVTCHRAHASSAPDAGRWDFNVTFMEDDGLESGSYKIPNPYGTNQRSLCNKCHSKDRFNMPRPDDTAPLARINTGKQPKV